MPARAGGGATGVALGQPRLHLRVTGSTSDRARALAAGGAPHGTLVTATEQTAGRGRQGRTWTAPAGRALLMSLVLHNPPPLLPLAAGAAVAEALGEAGRLKWPNDVLIGGRKVAGMLAEGRPADGWAVLGIGVNVAVDPAELPPELQARAGTLGRSPDEVERVLDAILRSLGHWLEAPSAAVLEAVRARDALRGSAIEWAGGSGTASGIDGSGRLVVALPDGGSTALEAGEIHLSRQAGSGSPSG